MKVKFFITVFVLVFTGISVCLPANTVQQGKVALENTVQLYPLIGKWRFQTGDDLKYASGNFDDSSWGWASIPGVWSMMGIEYTEQAWYRLRFTLSNRFAEIPVAVQVPVIYDAHELYLNGIFIGGAGLIDSNGTVVKKGSLPGIYQMPKNLLRMDEENVLALRVADDVGWGGVAKSDFMIGRYELLDLQFTKFIIWNSSLVFILIFLGTFFLMLYRTYSKEKNFLYFSLLTYILSTLLFGYYSLPYLLVDRFWFVHIVTNTGAHLAMVFLFKFVYSFYGFRKDLVLRFFTYSGFLIAFLLISPFHVTLLKFYAHIIYNIAIVIDAFGLLILVGLLIKGIALKRYQSKIVGIGSLVAFACVANDIAGYFLALDNQQWMMEGLVIFMISISFAMFIRYSRLDSRIVHPALDE
ncbi:MAG: hypothetical protein MJE63_34035 [Proteobacteria bacterium]|nr:hypothetical protein [Pseudomonadota bacterium]